MKLSGLRKALVLGAAALATAAAAVSTPSGAVASSRWAPADKATITPGVQMFTAGAQCTGNFVFTDSLGRVYVGYAAHCAGKGAATDTNGCKTESLPVGTKVRFESGGTYVSAGTLVGRGRLAYSSWRTMQAVGTKDGATCAYNDLALVRVAKSFVSHVNPSVPDFGGPTGIRKDGLPAGDQVYTYGNSILRAGVTATSPKTGVSTGDDGNGWSHNVYTVSPGIPGDSGSGFLDSDGRALGVLSTIAIAPTPGENGVGDLGRELAFAQQYSGIPGLRLVKGTEPFVGLG